MKDVIEAESLPYNGAIQKGTTTSTETNSVTIQGTLVASIGGVDRAHILVYAARVLLPDEHDQRTLNGHTGIWR